VTKRRGSPPRHDAAKAASRARRMEAPRPGHEDMLRVVPVEVPKAAPSATRSRHKTTAVTTAASIELSPAALLHLDESKARALLDDGSNKDMIEGWCLDTGATHHMTGRREFFTELDSSVRGSVKFWGRLRRRDQGRRLSRLYRRV
jgi:hypothetical protein